ncbi:MAG: hypothetical protein ONB46_13660 [candidate division KSB1 bacterium]|nr:hypothetical protein [candidate division KSB1 bacterium]MDZ7367509.1 hypothetical protein [candidate division KSB1 bacterium]MDZ7404933.1 hypothetical protein [candidate division KSB1 bacterium]
MTPLQLKFVDNAFKHGVTEDEIWEVFLNRNLPCLIVLYKKSGAEKIYNVFGASETGRYLVIGFVKETERTDRVIHANDDMKDFERKRFKKLRHKK